MNNRIVIFKALLLAAVAVVGLRLAYLQLIQGSHYRVLAENNRLRVVPETGPRGLILDRSGRLLASNHTVFRIALVPQEVEDLEALFSRVSVLTKTPVESLQRKYKLHRSFPFVPATIVSQITKEMALQLEEERLRLPGLIVQADTIRHYPQGNLAAHLLGYLGRPSPEELPVLKEYGVRPQHWIGRAGLERNLDAYLRGRSGGVVVEVDNRTRRVRRIGEHPSDAGETVTLTIDAPLQSLIEEALGEQIGAVTVLQPETGEILAMVSRPDFFPEDFINGHVEAVRGYLSDPKAPLMNRASRGTYAPGSISKLITAVAALEEGVITPANAIECHGGLRIGDRTIHCWNRDGHGPVNLYEAIRVSCNVYFMTLARWLGRDRMLAAMTRMGWGQPTGWPMSESMGYLPQQRLMPGEVAMLGIGQGALLVTTLQVAVMVSVFANNGWIIEPWVVKAVGERKNSKRAVKHAAWAPEILQWVREGMRQAVQERGGTAFRAGSDVISVAGKTGTAQTGPGQAPHGWFIGFCPMEQPRVAIAVVAEHGGSGGNLPAEIGGTICEYVSVTESF